MEYIPFLIWTNEDEFTPHFISYFIYYDINNKIYNVESNYYS